MAAKRFTLANAVISHPTTYFIITWSVCAILISMDLIPRITQYSVTALSIYYELIAFNLAGVAFAWFASNKARLFPPQETQYLFPKRNNLVLVWMIGTVLEVIISGGVPLLWLAIGNGRTYEDFGVPSIHGFMNAIYLFLTLTAFMNALMTRSRRSFVEFVLLVGWSLIVVSRALMAIALLQSATFFLINSRASWRKKTLLLSLAGTAFFIAFGMIGNARVEEFSILEATNLADIDPKYNGLVWIYVYLVSPIANLALNSSIHSTEFKIIPTTFLLPLLPSAIQNWLGFQTGFLSFSGYLAHDAFNVGTAFIQIFIDWGMFGVFLYDVALGFLGHVVWRSYRRTGRTDILSLFIPCIVLTVFSNQFNQLPVILLFILMTTFTRVRALQGAPSST